MGNLEKAFEKIEYWKTVFSEHEEILEILASVLSAYHDTSESPEFEGEYVAIRVSQKMADGVFVCDGLGGAIFVKEGHYLPIVNGIVQKGGESEG